MMQLYNSQTSAIEPLNPINPGTIGLYSCGPTVYNNLHIGNLSAFIYADVLRRVLRASGLSTRHIMNITDVDDKTIRDSKTAYPDEEPLAALQQLTDKYAQVFMRDMELVGNDLAAVEFVSAVDSIPDMVHLIQRIADNGFAYTAEDGIYFSIAKYTTAGHRYGVLQAVHMAAAQSRVANDEYDKDSASDFALWKAAVPGEPAWDARFHIGGKTIEMPGRPGWHIECSAMSQKLGVPFDIHTGGIDLKFPHHENEIAQSVAAGASALASVFVHNNHILVDGRKMSKSLGNVTTLRDIEDKGYSPLAFRLLVLESHYQSESNFSWAIMEAAAHRLKKWQAWADVRYQLSRNHSNTLQPDEINKYRDEFLSSMQDNLATPKALAEIHAGLEQAMVRGIDIHSREHFEAFLLKIAEVLGIDLTTSEPLAAELQDMLNQRQKARENKDWAASDRLRDLLAEKGLHVLDDPERGQIWQRF